MTYCVGISVDQGMVFMSDSRTNAGVDQISSFSKMHQFPGDGERSFTLLSAGNLATSQAVVTRLHRDLESDATINLRNVKHLSAAAEYVGRIGRDETGKVKPKEDDDLSLSASFIFGGEIAGRPPALFLIYPEGNYIRASYQTPYLQIGELKYGKPILDRIITRSLSLEDAARCALVSMDSTIRSNASVGPPIELLLYDAGSLKSGRHIVLEEFNEYLISLRAAWESSLRKAFNDLPRLPAHEPSVRLVDG